MGFWRDLFKKRRPEEAGWAEGNIPPLTPKMLDGVSQEDIEKMLWKTRQTIAKLKEVGRKDQQTLADIREGQRQIEELNKKNDRERELLAQDLKELKSLREYYENMEKWGAEQEKRGAEQEKRGAELLQEWRNLKDAFLRLTVNDPEFEKKMAHCKERAERLRVRFKDSSGRNYDFWKELQQTRTSSKKEPPKDGT